MSYATSVTAPAIAPKSEAPSSAPIPAQSAGDISSASADCPYRPSPTYPATISGKNEKGDVQLSISITAKGKIDAVDVRQSSGVPILDETARNTVLEKWRCVPAHQNGKDVAARVGVLIQFVVK